MTSGSNKDKGADNAAPADATPQSATNDNSQDDQVLKQAEKLLNDEDSHTGKLAMGYMVNLLKHTDPQSPFAYRLCHAAEVELKIGARGYKFPKNKEKNRTYYENKNPAPRGRVDADDWETLKRYFANEYKKAPEGEAFPFYRNLMKLADHLDLDEDEKQVLEILYVLSCSSPTDSFLSRAMGNDRGKLPPAFARMLDKPRALAKTQKILSASGPLRSYGLIYVNEDSYRFSYDIDPTLWENLSEKDLDEEAIVGNVLGKPVKTALTIKDFEHVGPELEFMLGLIKRAIKKGESGINILLYGPPGGGKTELAKAIAGELGISLYAVGEEDDEPSDESKKAKGGSEAETSAKRMAQLSRTHALLKGNKKALALFDEIEDLLKKGTDTEKAADTESKIQVNRLLETNPVVTIWTGNDPQKFHPAVRQRFSFSLFMGYPPTMVRKKIWERQLAMKGVQLDDREVLELTRKFSAPPRMIEKAVRGMQLYGGGTATIEQMLEADSKIVYGHREAVLLDNRLPENFEPSLLGTDRKDLDKFIGGLVERGKEGKKFALYVDGCEGSGASSLLRYMNEEMCRNILEVSMEDIAAAGGMTSPEAVLEDVFNSAADGKLFLVLNDIEKIVPSPQSASEKWGESSLVKTFRKAAKGHSQPYAVINRSGVKMPDIMTNLFSHEVEMKPLDTKQAATMYKNSFGRKAPKVLKEFKNIMPGDFADATHALSLCDEDENRDAQIVKELKKAAKLRSEGNVKWMGIDFG